MLLEKQEDKQGCKMHKKEIIENFDFSLLLHNDKIEKEIFEFTSDFLRTSLNDFENFIVLNKYQSNFIFIYDSVTNILEFCIKDKQNFIDNLMYHILSLEPDRDYDDTKEKVVEIFDEKHTYILFDIFMHNDYMETYYGTFEEIEIILEKRKLAAMASED